MEDIKNCKTQREVLRVFAQLNNGLVSVTNVSRLIKESKLSKGKLSSIRSTVHNYMNESEEFKYEEPGIFRWELYRVNGSKA